MDKKLEEKTKEALEKKLDEEGLTTNNLELIYKLKKINHMAKEDSDMYGNYNGRGPGHGSYGEYNRGGYGNYEGYGEYGRDAYGRRGRDMKYRGDDELDRMYGEYGRYQENRSRYGAGEETDKSFFHMVEAYKDFGKVLYEEAETPQQKQMLKSAVQSMMM